MSQPLWAQSDDELLAAVKAALAAPPPPQHLAEAAKASYAWRSVDSELELMLLVGDSAERPASGVRGPGGGLRLLDFRSDSLNLEVEVGDGFVMGQIIPMQAARLTLTTPDGVFAETSVDETGSFRLPRPPVGPVRLVCRTASGELATEWTRV